MVGQHFAYTDNSDCQTAESYHKDILIKITLLCQKLCKRSQLKYDLKSSFYKHIDKCAGTWYGCISNFMVNGSLVFLLGCSIRPFLQFLRMFTDREKSYRGILMRYKFDILIAGQNIDE